MIEINNQEKIIFAGGCFWCTEGEFSHTRGIVSAISGYTDSEKDSPSYEEVSSGRVRAREAVEVTYDKDQIPLDEVLDKYWQHIDPTDKDGQFADKGYQYTTAIYYMTEEQKNMIEQSKEELEKSKKFSSQIMTLVLPFVNFYPAEEYHQNFKDKNKDRYESYREGSGRNSFLKLHWQDGSVSTREIYSKQEKLKTLTPLEYKVTQESGTEAPFENEYNSNKEVGVYVDVVSGELLYLSSDKYDSGSGWPSFTKPAKEEAITLHPDEGIFQSRTEVRSKIADSHLGHVFSDGPKDKGGMRYCMNSAAMRFVPLSDMEKEGYGEYISMLTEKAS